ncbi:MAG TPA: hypothetical protein VFL82_05200 [Thermomicrobiales bacterium]|nr:hypothetical protein [Thermomicrobiales bacterium]
MIRRTFVSMALTALVCVLAASPALADGAVRSGFTGKLALTNPCNDEVVSGSFPIDIIYQATPNGDHYNIHISEHGTLAGSYGNSYRYNMEGSGVFDAPTGDFYFDVPFHSVFADPDGHLTFTFDGIDQLYFSPEGQIAAARFTSSAKACAA